MLFAAILATFGGGSSGHTQNRPRVREAGVKVGVLPTGPLNAITDVQGVLVGHTTLIRGDDIRTGVTAILPHNGNLFREKVPGAVFVGNGFGKLAGSTQVNELGESETVLQQHEGVREAVVLLHGAAEQQQLVGYVVSAAGSTVTGSEVSLP